MSFQKLTAKQAVMEVVREAREKGCRYSEINERMGWSGSGYRQLLERKTMNVETFVRLANLLGYEVTIQPKKEKGQRLDGQILILQDEEARRIRPSEQEKHSKNTK